MSTDTTIEALVGYLTDQLKVLDTTETELRAERIRLHARIDRISDEEYSLGGKRRELECAVKALAGLVPA